MKAFNGSSITTANALQANKTYKVSVWAKGGTPQVSGYAPITGSGINAWTLYEWTVSNLTSVTIVSNGSLLDDVRLHPKESHMTTYGYKPLVGVTSKTDNNHKMEFYEYDGAARLRVIRDDKNNVLKTFKYHFIQD
jgi:hypothetical protein